MPMPYPERKRKPERVRYCWNCGAALGVIWAPDYDMYTCGRSECKREARRILEAEPEAVSSYGRTSRFPKE